MGRASFSRSGEEARRRADQRAEAREAEETFLGALSAGRRGELREGKIAAPPPLERRAERFGGGYIARSSSFFTDKEGRVHPIRASEHDQRYRLPKDTHDYGADEAF